MIYYPNQDTLRLKGGIANNYSRSTGINLDCPGKMGHLSTLKIPQFKLSEKKKKNQENDRPCNKNSRDQVGFEAAQSLSPDVSALPTGW